MTSSSRLKHIWQKIITCMLLIIRNVCSTATREWLTTLIVINAAGDISPPMVVYKYKRIPAGGMGYSESGWMNGVVFYE